MKGWPCAECGKRLRRSPNVRLLTEFWPEGMARGRNERFRIFGTLRDDLGFRLWEVNEKAECLVPVTEFTALIARHPGRAYANLLCGNG